TVRLQDRLIDNDFELRLFDMTPDSFSEGLVARSERVSVAEDPRVFRDQLVQVFTLQKPCAQVWIRQHLLQAAQEEQTVIDDLACPNDVRKSRPLQQIG